MASMRVLLTTPADPRREVVVQVTGDIDERSAPAVQREIRAALAWGSGPVVLDCRDIGLVDPTGLATLVYFARISRIRGRRPVLRHVSRPLAQVLRTTRAEAAFDIEGADGEPQVVPRS